MFLASGDVHECDFVNGRAHGDGTYVSAKGIESIGRDAAGVASAARGLPPTPPHRSHVPA